MVNKKYRQIFNQSLMINFLIFCEIFVVNFQKKKINKSNQIYCINKKSSHFCPTRPNLTEEFQFNPRV